MSSILKKGAWRQFRIAILLNGWSNGWDSIISRKIFMILQTEELLERYLSGFPRLLSSEKLELSLDDIIDPIGVGEKKSQEANCHPGRLTLNPDAYHHAGMWFRKWQVARGCARWAGKHRLLARPVLDDGTTWNHLGLQDVYFLGGLPLIYWCREGVMGMRVLTKPLEHGYRMPELQWKSAKDQSEYTRMWYLPTEETTFGPNIPEDWTPRDRVPRTYWGNQRWTDRHAGGKTPVDEFKDGRNDTYINYLQIIEDIYRASHCHEMNLEDYCRIYAEELSGVEVRTLGGW